MITKSSRLTAHVDPDRRELGDGLTTSHLTRLECARVAIRERNDALARTAEEFLDTIRLIPISDAVVEAAMDIPFPTKSLDAIHIASMAARDVILTSERNMALVLNALKAHPDYARCYDFREIVG